MSNKSKLLILLLFISLINLFFIYLSFQKYIQLSQKLDKVLYNQRLFELRRIELGLKQSDLAELHYLQNR